MTINIVDYQCRPQNYEYVQKELSSKQNPEIIQNVFYMIDTSKFLPMVFITALHTFGLHLK